MLWSLFCVLVLLGIVLAVLMAVIRAFSDDAAEVVGAVAKLGVLAFFIIMVVAALISGWNAWNDPMLNNKNYDQIWGDTPAKAAELEKAGENLKRLNEVNTRPRKNN